MLGELVEEGGREGAHEHIDLPLLLFIRERLENTSLGGETNNSVNPLSRAVVRVVHPPITPVDDGRDNVSGKALKVPDHLGFEQGNSFVLLTVWACGRMLACVLVVNLVRVEVSVDKEVETTDQRYGSFAGVDEELVEGADSTIEAAAFDPHHGQAFLGVIHVD